MYTKFIAFIIIIFSLFSGEYLYGQEYFQQEVNYTIHVELNDQKHFLTGFETIQYTNNSPDRLTSLYFHLWPNAYKNNQTALAREQMKVQGKHHLFSVESQRGYIDSLNFRVNGEKVQWEYHPDHIDICRLTLNEPLQSGETITITTPFRVKIPLAVTSRMGHIDQFYQITQWYPKPAVYDQKGWHPMPYLDQAEFYSEFGSFDVSITIPENYVVAASGKLQTQSEIKWLNDKADRTARSYYFDRDALENPPSRRNKKTIRFTIKNAHDFAWSASKKFQVLKDSIKLASTDKKVTSWAFFFNTHASLWKNAPEHINQAIQYFSDRYGNYPYNEFKAVQSIPDAMAAGMEYPGMAFVGQSINEFNLEEIIAHETAHNWFYGMLGFNERAYPYLDEGLSTFSESRYLDEQFKNDLKLYQTLGFSNGWAGFLGFHFMDHDYLNELLYLFKARKNIDQPLNLSSKQFSESNYKAIAYGKSTKSFDYLMHYLGEDQFDSIMAGFISQWKFKHPYPNDLKNYFTRSTDKRLDWFFDGLVNTNKKIDYSIKRYKNNKILIKNKGDIKAPLFFSGKKNGETIFYNQEDGFLGKKWITLPDENPDEIIIDPKKKMLELYRENNHIKTSGLFKKTEPLRLQFAGLYNNPEYTQIHFSPALGWNYYDKAMFGLLFYDSPLPQNKFDYYLAPTFSSANGILTGMGSLSLQTYPNKYLSKIQLKLSGKRFSISDVYQGQYKKLKGELTLDIRGKNKPGSPITKLKSSAIYATAIEDIEERILNNPNQDFSNNLFANFSFIHGKPKRTINPYKFSANLQWNKDFLKTWIEGQYKVSYYMEEGLTIRGFGGTFLSQANSLPWNYAFHLSGENGFLDYSYENTYFGRFEPPQYENAIRIFAQQFFPSDGAFALYSQLGVTKDWLASINLKTSLPIIKEIPIHAYANFGLFGETKKLPFNISNRTWAIESGIKLSFLNIVDVYFPVKATKNLEEASDYISTEYGEKIRFHIKFNLLKPKSIVNNLSF